ncbi:MAG: threonine/serine dehydratase [Candidatus Heimdallarchaeota archaeon]|nr:threonine/serine dehydratase [Candidatus Heimdallarchaeota archaeon]MCK4954040.1 threonine/serine dehydratase [Candidatus Heimdallarchaeota archaeon]
MNIRKEALEAEQRIKKYIRKTPLEYSPFLSKLGDCNVFLKLENLQQTGSFKIRGAMNKILSSPNQKRFITASSGNHGVAVAYTLDKFELEGSIYLPENTSKTKIDALQNYDIETSLFGNDCVQTELFAQQIARERDIVFISPYNDLKIIGGQATIGIELEQQLDVIDTVFVPIGGGGLISGIAGYLKSSRDQVKIVGCQPENSPVMFESVKAGKIVEMESKPTISDGTAGGIEHKSITFEICRKYVNDYVLVNENQIKQSIILALDKHSLLIEGAAALSIASFVKVKEKFKGQNIVLLLTGNKISNEKLKEVLC